MIVKLEQDLSAKDIEILIKYATMNNDVKRITNMLAAYETQVRCKLNDIETLVNVSDIYYFESVDKKTFIYCENNVYETGLRLYQIMDDFSQLGFTQISKSCVLNINMLDSIHPLLNRRAEAVLTNGERIYISRNYLNNIKNALKEVAWI